MDAKTLARFEAKYIPEPNTGCWLWTAGIGAAGYGTLLVGSFTDGTRHSASAHRLSYEHHVGPIPPGMLVCHRCDVPSCVAPHHLFLGTPADNMQDMLSKGRNRCGRLRGEAASRAKLTAVQVHEIRRKRARGALWRVLATEYGVAETTVRRAALGMSWRHLRAVDSETGGV